VVRVTSAFEISLVEHSGSDQRNFGLEAVTMKTNLVNLTVFIVSICALGFAIWCIFGCCTTAKVAEVVGLGKAIGVSGTGADPCGHAYGKGKLLGPPR
jgi:hypothetical protein